jgi:hypothetical protein
MPTVRRTKSRPRGGISIAAVKLWRELRWLDNPKAHARLHAQLNQALGLVDPAELFSSVLDYTDPTKPPVRCSSPWADEVEQRNHRLARELDAAAGFVSDDDEGPAAA